jgi:hypothetical protein
MRATVGSSKGAGAASERAKGMSVSLPAVSLKHGCARYPDNVDDCVVEFAKERTQECSNHRMGRARLEYTRFVLPLVHLGAHRVLRRHQSQPDLNTSDIERTHRIVE